MDDLVYVIAEAGVNHNGSMERARQLVQAAADAGADAVKFQIFQAEKLVSQNATKADYQKEMTDSDETQLSMLKNLELNYGEFEELKLQADSLGIDFLSTAFDSESIEFLKRLNVRFQKVPSGEITNYPYLVEIARTGMPIILSTGMSTLQEVEAAFNVLREEGTTQIIILHCNTEYPTPLEDVNLRAMDTLADHFQVSVGYSDHTQGIVVPIAAAARGAKIIEKHFTLSRELPGPDHKASLEPDELSEMIRCIRHVTKVLGDKEKKPSPSEVKNIAVARRSIVASRPIKCGDTFDETNLTSKRPGDGISPMNWLHVIGRKAKRDYAVDEKISL